MNESRLQIFIRENFSPILLNKKSLVLSFLYFLIANIILALFILWSRNPYDGKMINYEFLRSLAFRDAGFLIYLAPISATLARFLTLKKALLLAIIFSLIAIILTGDFRIIFYLPFLPLAYPQFFAPLFGGLLIGYVSRFFTSKLSKTLAVIFLIIIGSILIYKVERNINNDRPISLEECQALDGGYGYEGAIKNWDCYRRFAIQNNEFLWCSKGGFNTLEMVDCIKKVISQVDQKGLLDASFCDKTKNNYALIEKVNEEFSFEAMCKSVLSKYKSQF